jgi:uncharacterized protein (TIGR02611 family)
VVDSAEVVVGAGSRRYIRRVAVGIAGGVLLIVGIIAIPYPGPGWLIVFTALAILATEFTWAQRVLDYAKGKYDAWEKWLAGQVFWVRALFWVATCVVVVLTIWLLNGYGILNNLLHLGQDWLQSPFVR